MSGLKDIAKKLLNKPFKGVMFPLTALNNFKIKDGLSDYQSSVSAPMFYALAVLDKLLEKIIIDGKKVFMQVEAAMVDPQNKIKEYKNWQEKCKKDKSLRPTQHVNPRVKKPPKTIGAGIDLSFVGEDGKPILLPKDLLKENHDPKGNWKNQKEQERLKATYLKKFSSDTKWCDNIEENLRLNAHPDENERELKEKIAKEIVACNANMFPSSHAKLTKEGMKDPDARKAIKNKDILVQILRCIPFLTCTNDMYYTAQLCRFFGGMDMLKKLPLLFGKKFYRQKSERVKELSEQIIEIANKSWESAVCYKRKLVKGQRIDFWNKPSINNPEIFTDYKYVLEQIKEIQRNYEEQEKKIKDREILLKCCKEAATGIKLKPEIPKICKTNEARQAYLRYLGVSDKGKMKLSLAATLYLNGILDLPNEQKQSFADLMLLAYSITKNSVYMNCYNKVYPKQK